MPWPRTPSSTSSSARSRSIRQQEPKANVLIYTEYVDSQRAAVAALKAMPGIGTVLTMCGDDNDKVRQAVTERFREQQGLILVSTDSAAEGLNLHQRCHHLIHMELPFNPNRLEQRNGRIDRYGQQLRAHRPLLLPARHLRGPHPAAADRQVRAAAGPAHLRPQHAGADHLQRCRPGAAAGGHHGRGHQALPRGADAVRLPARATRRKGPIRRTKELLEEIDRSLKGFEQAARTNTWLGEAGLNAEEKLLDRGQRGPCGRQPRQRRGPGRVRLRCRPTRRRPARRPGRRRSLSASPAVGLALRVGRPARLRP